MAGIRKVAALRVKQEKPLCASCCFAVPMDWRGGVVFFRFECNQKGRGWLKTCAQYEREPGSDDE